MPFPTTNKDALDRTSPLPILRYCLRVMSTTHDQRHTVRVDSLDRLRQMTATLNDRLVEAEDTRARFVKALNANRWPDLPSMSRLFTDIQRPAS